MKADDVVDWFGQVLALSYWKPLAMLGLLPEVDGGMVNGILPMLDIVTVCGLSVLVAPTLVVAKLKLGGAAKSSFNTGLLAKFSI